MNRFSHGEFVTIIVRNARTHIEEGRATFTDYEVEVKTNHMAFTIKESKVRRRYSDFVWLRNRLAKDLMTSNPPSLPGKKLFGRFNTDFINHRQRRLQDFLMKVVKNNVFLSHVALHLFLQSKMSVEEIEEYIDSKGDDEPYDTILSQSAFKESLYFHVASFSKKDSLPSKEDSGIESCGHEFAESGESRIVGNMHDDDDGLLTDGNAADSEDNAEEELADFDNNNNNTDEDQHDEDLRKLRMTSLPSMEVTQDLESSVEYLSSHSSGSNKVATKKNFPITPQEPQSASGNPLTSSRKSPTKTRRRRRTCIPQFDLPKMSPASTTVKHEEKEMNSPSSTAVKKKTNLRRCFSLEKKARPFPVFEIPNYSSHVTSKSSDCDVSSCKTSRSSLFRSSSSRIYGSAERFKSRFSGSEERSKSLVKRNISLNEYDIIKREECCHDGLRKPFSILEGR